MRVLLTLALAFALSACGTTRVRRAAPVHAKPDVGVVTRPVSAARASAGRASGHVAIAIVRADRAAAAAKTIVEHGAPPQSQPAQQLAADVAALRADLLRASAELREADEKLTESETRAAELDAQLAAQTARLNKVEADRTAALDRVEELTAERNLAKRALFWARLKSWGIAGGLVALLVAAFAFKAVGLGARFVSLAALCFFQQFP
jgi:hypothetical protein